MKKIILSIVCILFVIHFNTVAQSYYYGVDFDTVKAQKFDMGKMWTFENPPLDYFEETYGFRPTKEWLESSKSLKFEADAQLHLFRRWIDNDKSSLHQRMVRFALISWIY
jgi:hypothetical protein